MRAAVVTQEVEAIREARVEVHVEVFLPFIITPDAEVLFQFQNHV